MKPYLPIFLTALMAATSSAGVVDGGLQQRFILGGRGDTQNVMISFNQGIQQVIEKINAMNFSNIAEKRTALTNAQQTFSDASQKPLQGFLNTMGVKYESFWISNQMVVPNVNSGLVKAMSNVPGVAKVEEEPVIKISLPFGGIGEIEEDVRNFTRSSRQTNVEWGVRKIRADQVWGQVKGKGVVVAGIDTGVRGSHEALRGNWRSEYGWYDPYSFTETPNDDNGHGTHIQGTISGANGIGVAPESTWIACKGCNSRGCAGRQLLACGQWVQCPTRPNGNRNTRNCSMAPDVVSNSWGGGQGQSWYDDTIKSWQAAGIIPVFAIGNDGPNCGSANSPGDRQNVIAVGSLESNDRISSFSSLGPETADGRVKPDISAPGGRVRSSWHTGDRNYNTISGTSMACPHVAGVVALILQKNGNLNYQQVYNLIANTAEIEALDKSNAKTCGSRRPTDFPNNVFGYGRVDALNAINGLK